MVVQREGEVERGAARMHRTAAHPAALELDVQVASGPVRERHLAERMAARVTRQRESLDQALERHLPRAHRGLHRALRAPQCIRGVGRAGQVEARRHEIGEQSEHLFPSPVEPRSHRQADDEFGPGGQAREQDAPRGEEGCAGRDAETVRCSYERVACRGRHPCAGQVAASARDRGTAEVRRERELGHVGEARTQRLECLRGRGRCRFLRQRSRVRMEVARERRQARGSAAAGQGVRGREVVAERPLRKRVAEDVVPDAQQRVPAGAEREERPADRRRVRDVERDAAALARRVLERSLGAFARRGQVRELDDRAWRSVHALDGHAVDVRETRAQHRLAGRRGIEGGHERADVERALDRPQRALVVNDRRRIESLDEP